MSSLVASRRRLAVLIALATAGLVLAAVLFLTTGPATGGAGDGGDGDREEASGRDSVVVTLSWSSGPENLDLHVQTPDAEEGGEVWAGNPCLSRQDGTCWAFASSDAVAFGSETVTLRPLGLQEDGDWLRGGYRVWVENASCQEATFETSDATVTVSRAGGESVSLPVSGVSGGRDLSRWNVGSVFMTRHGEMAVVGTQSVVGDLCGPT